MMVNGGTIQAFWVYFEKCHSHAMPCMQAGISNMVIQIERVVESYPTVHYGQGVRSL